MMFRYEVRGYFIENGNRISFVVTTPPYENAYQAELYVMGRLKEYEELNIIHDNTARVID